MISLISRVSSNIELEITVDSVAQSAQSLSLIYGTDVWALGLINTLQHIIFRH